MKKLFITSAIALSGLIYNTANAQIRIQVGLNLLPHRIAIEPAIVVDAPQAPAVYDDQNATADDNPADDYYYLPDYNAYYDVADQCYYYYDGDDWVSAAYLPGEYNNFDWRAARHFEVRAALPYLHNDVYMNRFHGANFNWARYRAPQSGNLDQRMANRDNHQPNRQGGFDNRGSYGQNFDNGNRVNIQNRGNNRPQQFNPAQGNQNRDRGFGQPANQNAGNRGNQQARVAQNNNKGNYGGHVIANRRMF